MCQISFQLHLPIKFCGRGALSVKWIYTLKNEPFSLTLWTDFAADVGDDGLVDKSFLKRLIVSKKKMLSRQIQYLKRNCKSNKTKLIINNLDFKVPTRC